MATRSIIFVEQEGGTFKGVRCHFDGYLEGVGLTLLKHYATIEDARALVEMGHIRAIESSIETSQFYNRDKGEGFDIITLEAGDSDLFMDREYAYLMTSDGVWHYMERAGGWTTSIPPLTTCGVGWKPLAYALKDVVSQ